MTSLLLRMQWSSNRDILTLEKWADITLTCLERIKDLKGAPDGWVDSRSGLTLDSVESAYMALQTGHVRREADGTTISDLGSGLVTAPSSGARGWELHIRVNVTSRNNVNRVVLTLPAQVSVEANVATEFLGDMLRLWRPDEATWTCDEILVHFTRPYYGTSPRQPGWISWFADPEIDPYVDGEQFAGGTLHVFAPEVSEAATAGAIEKIAASAK